MHRDILYAMTVQFGNFSIEEPMLVAVNDTPVSDNDCVEGLHCQRVENREPEAREPDARDKEIQVEPAVDREV